LGILPRVFLQTHKSHINLAINMRSCRHFTHFLSVDFPRLAARKIMTAMSESRPGIHP
jgi:hypothetical protein